MESIEKSIHQIGASLAISLFGSPDQVESEFNKLVNFDMVQLVKADGARVPEIISGSPTSCRVSFMSNLPRFNRAVKGLTRTKIREIMAKKSLGFKKSRKLFLIAKTKIEDSFEREPNFLKRNMETKVSPFSKEEMKNIDAWLDEAEKRNELKIA